MRKSTNFLTDWKINQHGIDCTISGYIFDDEKKRFEDGTFIETSRIKSINFETGVVETRNSVYQLYIPD